MRCSVVIPTYNRKESLRRTLDALAAQMLPQDDFEVVVVSDGSSDGTDALLAEYAQSGKLKSLRWFTQANAGPAVARNRGVEEAQAEIIVFTDDDVEPVPEFLERHLSHHIGDEKVVVIGPLSPNPRWVDREPVWIAWEHAKLQAIYELFQSGPYAGGRPGFMHFYSGNASVRRRWLIDAGGFNPEFKRQEDTELAERLLRLCGVRFEWDFQADGPHHPVRTLASWLKIPSAYGALDAERVRAGTLDSGHVERIAQQRHGATKRLAQLCTAAPALLSPLSWVLCAIAVALYGCGRKSAGLSALSAVYNVRYAVAFEQQMAHAQPARPAAQTQ